MPWPLFAGLVKGTLSALITLLLKRAREALSRRFTGSTGVWLPPLTASTCSLILLGAIHWLPGTPEIARTLLVPLTVATLYAVLYTSALRCEPVSPYHGACSAARRRRQSWRRA